MTNALTIINYIFSKFIDLFFDKLTIANNVTIGWVMIVIIIFGIMIYNILSVAKSSQSHFIERDNE